MLGKGQGGSWDAEIGFPWGREAAGGLFCGPASSVFDCVTAQISLPHRRKATKRYIPQPLQGCFINPRVLKKSFVLFSNPCSGAKAPLL